MKGRIIGGIMVAIGGFFVIVAIMAIVGRPGTEKKIKEAAWVTDGKVDPANEGKNVILVVKNLQDFEGSYDEDFGLHFPYLGVVRYAERLEEVAYGNYKWNRQYETDKFPNQKNIFGKLKGTDYEISGDLLVSVGRLVNVHGNDLDGQELKAYLKENPSWRAEEWGSLRSNSESRFYITDTDTSFFENYGEDEETSANGIKRYKQHVGGSRVYYKYRDFSDCKNVAIIGKQKGNKLVRDDSVDTIPAFENVKSKEELIKNDRLYLIGGVVVFAGLGCGALIFFGIRKIKNAI